MAYLINNYDGTPLVNVQDRTLDITTTSIKLPGRDYRPYGETIVENLVYMLQNFAQGVPPANPINGQLWFDTSVKQIKVYDVITLTWLPVANPESGVQLPAQGVSGQVFYHTVKRQVFVWDNTLQSWRLVGPVGAWDNADPINPPLSPHSTWEVIQIPVITAQNTVTNKPIWRLVIGGQPIMVISSETFRASLVGFTDPIQPGINLREGYQVVGTASRALVSDNSLALDGLPMSRFMRKDTSNEPDKTLVRELGSINKQYAKVYSSQFIGEASTSLQSTNSTQLNGEPASYYTDASNLASGTLSVSRLPASVMINTGATMTGFLGLSGNPVLPNHAANKQYVDDSKLKVYQSAQIPITTPDSVELLHGLTVVPQFVTVDLINMSADAGYSPGDVIQVYPGASQTGAASGLGIKKTNAQITIYVGANGPGIQIQGDETGTGSNLTTIKWNMVVRAYA